MSGAVSKNLTYAKEKKESIISYQVYALYLSSFRRHIGHKSIFKLVQVLERGIISKYLLKQDTYRQFINALLLVL